MNEKEWQILVDRLAKEIYDGTHSGNIDPDMVRMHAQELMGAIEQGYGTNLADAVEQAYDTLYQLQTNCFHFSGAKNWQQIQEMSAMITDKQGGVVPFAKYLESVRKIDATYNQTYLKAEYNHAIASGQMASKWDQFTAEADALPYLEYDAVMDERTREEHARLNTIVRPINDDFWKTWFPPNGWRCRCDVRQLDEVDADGRQNDALPKLPPVAPMFKNNVGESGMAFTDKHPYISTMPDKVKAAVFVASEKLMQGKAKQEYIPKDFFDKKKKFTIEEKQAVYALPIDEQFYLIKKYKGGGSTEVHKLYIPSDDHEDLLIGAKVLAKEGENMALLPVIDSKEKEARNKIMPGHKGNSNADYLANRKSLYELETPTTPLSITKIQERISSGYKQANNLILLLKDDMKTDVLKAEIEKQIEDNARKDLSSIRFISKESTIIKGHRD
jgi:SPP1 gp7 family putative phage head morphogenesis protein